MKSAASMRASSLTKLLIRTAAATLTGLTFCLGSIGLSGPVLVGAAGLTMAVTTPAHATCFIAGVARNDIPESKCVEAQRTGCVRSMLDATQYRNCLMANGNKQPSCVIKGVVRDDLSAEDCMEAKSTGCVQARLTPAQYQSCLDAQPVKR